MSPRRTLALACLLAPLWSAQAAASPTGEEGPPARRLLLELTSATRLAGTSGSLSGAAWVAHELEQAGLEVELDEREVLLSLPRRLELKLFVDLIAEVPFHEQYAAFDPDQKPPIDVPPFSAWSPSGELRAPAIDAGYGSRAEFEQLRAAGVEPAGKVALIRYGRSYRGVKVETAAEFGCKAVLLFSDPADDGAGKGDVWPVDRWKPGWAAQRGAILAIARGPGDPSTPGFASPAPGVADSRPRLGGAELDARLPSIPCLPIGADDAARVIEKLRVRSIPSGSSDPSATEDGAIERRAVGPGPVEVSLLVEAPRELRRIVNVIGRLDGAREQTVLCGNHRDAWVRGAHDAGSGTVALLRAAQILGERARSGWRPEHSIAFAFWDAEEFGLIGSTEWAEGHADWIREHLIAYVNGDAVVGGDQFHASGSPGMESALARALARVEDPSDRSRSLAHAWLDEAGPAGQLGLPGSGSDFTVFAHHLLVPVLDLGFGGARGGQYHTAFDDFQYVERFIDPGFLVHECAGQVFAELASEIAELGPLAFDEAWAVHELARHARAAEDALGREVSERLAAAFEGLETTIRATWSDWSRAQGAAASIEASFLGTQPSLPSARAAGRDLAQVAARIRGEPRLTALRERLFAQLAQEAGLAGRPWFRNRLWSPGLDSGYAAVTFPELRAAAESDRGAALESLLGAIENYRRSWETRLAGVE